MKTLLEREADIIKFGDVPEMSNLLPLLSEKQLVQFIERLAATTQWTLIEMAINDFKRRTEKGA
jgi:hypothetical protein